MSSEAIKAAVSGGKPFNVLYENGQTETVIIRSLPVRDYEKYLSNMDNEPVTAELLCQMPDGWADKLDKDSLGQLVTEGEEINRVPFVKWLNRRAARRDRLMSAAAPASKSNRELQS